MAVQTKFNKYENDRMIREKCEQTVLACSIDTAMKGGADKILSARANVSALRAAATDGQAAISGKLNVKAIYITPEGELDSVDYISDFSKTVSCPSAAEGATVVVKARVADVQAATEGDSIRIQTVVELCPYVAVHNEYELLEEAEDAFVKKSESEFTRLLGITETDLSVDEQYPTGSVVEKVLAFDSEASVTKVSADADGVMTEGEVSVTIVYQSEGKAVQKNMTIPFVQKTEGKEGALYDVSAEVRDSKLVIGGSATQNVFDVRVGVTLYTTVSENVSVSLATDAFCPAKELKISRMCLSYDTYCGTKFARERISGSVETQNDGIGVSRIVAALVQDNAVATTERKDGAAVVDGVLAVCVIYRDDNEDYKSVDVDLPYSVETELCGDPEKAEISVSACDITAKVKRDSEIEVSATVCVRADNFGQKHICAVDVAEEGAEISPCDDAISIYYAKKGETLWDISKKLGVSPEKIAAQNPETEEIAEEGKNIVVYREVAV